MYGFAKDTELGTREVETLAIEYQEDLNWDGKTLEESCEALEDARSKYYKTIEDGHLMRAELDMARACLDGIEVASEAILDLEGTEDSDELVEFAGWSDLRNDALSEGERAMSALMKYSRKNWDPIDHEIAGSVIINICIAGKSRFCSLQTAEMILREGLEKTSDSQDIIPHAHLMSRFIHLGIAHGDLPMVQAAIGNATAVMIKITDHLALSQLNEDLAEGARFLAAQHREILRTMESEDAE